MTKEDIFPVNQEIAIATCGANGDQPRAIYVMGKGLYEGKIIFGLCNQGKTFNNLTANPKISMAVKNEKGYFRVDGTVEIFPQGPVLEKLLSLCKPPMPQMAILVTISEILDLDKNCLI